LTTLEQGSRPRLRRGVKLIYDGTRETHVLLFPEGVLVPNATAAAVLGLCDGESTVVDMVTTLSKRFDGVRAEDIASVLTRFAERRVVEWS
jgi:pyrroloquinoline quinone biosynthesis protein D